MQKVNVNDLKYRDGASGVKYLFRGPKLDWGVIRLLPGQKLGAHYHERVEETFYFTVGTPLMVVNGERIRVRTGDAFRLDQTDKHDIINDTDSPVDAIFIKDRLDPDDKKSI
jgi:mannose-6-phosphate isomerase-like protein (cupin superfamily)